MKPISYPHLKETLYRRVLPNGLTVLVVPRPGFSKKLAYVVTDFGAIHTEFSIDGIDYCVPAGVAHYLEHKLFDMPGQDVNQAFAALGAIPNAFTGYDMTAYYFSCTQNFPQALDLLLDLVCTPYFTEESVAKEQGIIGQEIAMNLDNPDTQIFEKLMQAMYQTHPVCAPILGTQESIGQITPEILNLCHRAFYRPDNMLLCVIGDVDPEEVCRAGGKLPPPPRETVVPRRQWQEDMHCAGDVITHRMDIAMPTFHLGFKCEPCSRGRDAIVQEFIGELAAEALFGEASELYMQLYQQGIIDSSFGGGLETIEGMAVMLLAGDSHNPQTVLEQLLAQAAHIVQNGIPEADFLRMKRSAMGRRIRALDSFDSVLFRLSAYHFSGFDYFDFPGIYEEITLADLQRFLARVITRDRMRLAIFYPTKEDAQ